jgi:hypothetical protein
MSGMDFFKKLFFKQGLSEKKLKEEVLDKEKLEEEISRQPSGSILIQYFADNGDFTVYSDINDCSNESADILSILIYHIITGELEQYIYESIKLWADDEEKMDFYLRVLDILFKYESMIIKEKNTDDVAVKASEVFTIKDSK